MGEELKKDRCPDKYCRTDNMFKDIIPVLLALLFVTYVSGTMLNEGTGNTLVTVIVEVLTYVALTALYSSMIKKQKQRLAETYIRVCENGVYGVFAVNGYKNKRFDLYYEDISRITVKKDRLFIYSRNGNVNLWLTDPQGVADVIRSKNKHLTDNY